MFSMHINFFEAQDFRHLLRSTVITGMSIDIQRNTYIGMPHLQFLKFFYYHICNVIVLLSYKNARKLYLGCYLHMFLPNHYCTLSSTHYFPLELNSKSLLKLFLYLLLFTDFIFQLNSVAFLSL